MRYLEAAVPAHVRSSNWQEDAIIPLPLNALEPTALKTFTSTCRPKKTSVLEVSELLEKEKKRYDIKTIYRVERVNRMRKRQEPAQSTSDFAYSPRNQPINCDLSDSELDLNFCAAFDGNLANAKSVNIYSLLCCHHLIHLKKMVEYATSYERATADARAGREDQKVAFVRSKNQRDGRGRGRGRGRVYGGYGDNQNQNGCFCCESKGHYKNDCSMKDDPATPVAKLAIQSRCAGVVRAVVEEMVNALVAEVVAPEVQIYSETLPICTMIRLLQQIQ